MEEWNAGILGARAEITYLNCKKTPSNSSFHYSIIPVGAKPLKVHSIEISFFGHRPACHASSPASQARPAFA